MQDGTQITKGGAGFDHPHNLARLANIVHVWQSKGDERYPDFLQDWQQHTKILISWAAACIEHHQFVSAPPQETGSRLLPGRCYCFWEREDMPVVRGDYMITPNQAMTGREYAKQTSYVISAIADCPDPGRVMEEISRRARLILLS